MCPWYTVSMQALLLFRYAKWHFIEAPLQIIMGWGNLVWFVFNYFSVGLLVSTLFSPWKRIAWSYGRGFNVSRFLYVFSSNIISRVIGAIARSIFILVGSFAGLLTILAGITFLVLWLTLPFLIIVSFVYGVIILF